MGLTLDGNAELFAHVEKKCLCIEDNQICDCSRPKKMPYTDQITEIAPYVGNMFHVVTMLLPSNICAMGPKERVADPMSCAVMIQRGV